jgi:hypothetical protein
MGISRLGIILIVTCLLADMATPLCPGAFRLDPAESIDGLGSRMNASLPSHTNASSVPGHEAAEAEWSRSQGPTRRDLAARLPIRRALPRAALASAHLDLGSPRSSEDG